MVCETSVHIYLFFLKNAAVQTKVYKSSLSILKLLVPLNVFQCFEFSVMLVFCIGKFLAC